MKLSAREKIEIIQVDSYLKAGIDPRKIKTDSITEYPKYLNTEDRVNIIQRLKEIENRSEITDFQNLLDISEIIRIWDLVVDSNTTETDINLDNITIASAPTGNLNAMAITGANQSLGILFENDLHVWAITLSSIVVELITAEKEEGLYIYHPKDPKTYEEKAETMKKLVHFYLETIQRGRPPLLSNSLVESPSQRRLQSLIRRGFTSFIVGHEYAHLAKKHHQKKASRQGPFAIPKNINEIWNLYSSKYKNKFPEISVEEFSNKVIDQYMEIEADMEGYIYAANTYSKYPEDATGIMQNKEGTSKLPGTYLLMFVEIGVQLFLWSMEFLERLIRIVQRGEDGQKIELFSTDIEVQNIVLRQTHPCPLSRIKILSQMGTLSPFSSEWVSDLFSEFYKSAKAIALEMHNSGIVPHSKWTTNSTEHHEFLFSN